MKAPRLVLTLLLLMSLSAATADAQKSGSPELKQEDAEGDVRVFGPTAFPGTPSSVATDQADLALLRIFDESVDGIHVELKVKSLTRPQAAYWSPGYYVRFQTNGQPVTNYELGWFSFSSFGSTNQTPDFAVSLCLFEPNGRCNAQRVIGGADYANNQLTAYIPK